MHKATEGFSQQIDDLRKSLHNVETNTVDGIASDSCQSQPRLFDLVRDGVNGALPYMAREKFLETLRFDSIDDRYNSIATAHQDTLRWVLTPGSHQESSWHDFPSWLESTTRQYTMYWVAGKPGSGKSTLMRYLADSDLETIMQRSWGGSQPVRLLKCFFWNPGTTMQKSMEGLLRTLLYQALCDQDISEDLFQEIAPARWHSFMYDLKPRERWTVSELSLVFHNAVSAVSKQHSLLMFVDGLDEFGTDRAEREDLVNVFLGMHNIPNVKMCLSSRPWNEFKDPLGKSPGLKLEDLTRDDMRGFVQAELGSSRAIEDLAQVAPDEVSDLQEQLSSKADGVFLWLHLVTRRLKTAAQDGSSLRKLFEMLDHIPPDLDDFFQDMLRRIPDHDRVQASRIFQIVLDSHMGSLPSLMTLSFVDEDVSDFALLNAVKLERRTHILTRIVAFKRRLNSQCMDLLICGAEKHLSGYQWETTRVEYLHRTVKDFLESGVPQNVLLDYTGGRFDTSRYLCNAYLAQMIFMKNSLLDEAHIPNGLAQVYLFEGCTRISGYMQEGDNLSTRSLFESAVDQIAPVLDDGQTAMGGPVVGSLFSNTMQKICNTYKKYRIEPPHAYLLMAIASGFDGFAMIYIEQIPKNSDVSFYALCAVEGAKNTSGVINPGLLCNILKRARNFGDVVAAWNLLEFYHATIESELGTLAESGLQALYAAGTRLILEKTINMGSTQQRSDDFMDESKAAIGRIYSGPVAEELSLVLQEVRKTWRKDLGNPSAMPMKRSRLSWKVRTIFSSRPTA